MEEARVYRGRMKRRSQPLLLSNQWRGVCSGQKATSVAELGTINLILIPFKPQRHRDREDTACRRWRKAAFPVAEFAKANIMNQSSTLLRTRFMTKRYGIKSGVRGLLFGTTRKKASVEMTHKKEKVYD